jgi:hypothetical protein
MQYSERLNEIPDRRVNADPNRPRAITSLFSVPPFRVKQAALAAMLYIAVMIPVVGAQTSATGAKKVSPAPTSPKATTAPKAQPRGMLTQGGKAYVRIKEFEAEARKNASPPGEAQTFRFGDSLKLEAKWEGPPSYWLVSDGKGGPQSWIPGYLLTPSVAEIEMLRNKKRIPETMTYIYDTTIGGKVGAKQHGRVHMPGFGFVATINGDEGVDITDQGSSQVAIRGDAVVFDEAVVKQVWVHPMIFSDGTHKFPMAAGKLFYCTDEGGGGKFDVIVLP